MVKQHEIIQHGNQTMVFSTKFVAFHSPPPSRFIELKDISTLEGAPTTIPCPACGNMGTFMPLHGIRDLRARSYGESVGFRKCPNPRCGILLTCYFDTNRNLNSCHPPRTIDFDSSQIPESIVRTFGDALTCHSHGMTIPAAIMVRRTLEEICLERGAAGKDLFNRLDALKASVSLPAAMFNALHDLRLLGNDAAHLENKTYEQIGLREIEAAIAVTKEILKSIYQMDHIMVMLNDLKKDA